jgi:hypothetical protein
LFYLDLDNETIVEKEKAQQQKGNESDEDFD